MSQYFAYVRKSTEESDRQVASIPAQLSELRALVGARGLRIARIFEESQSARRPGRPVFAEMIREIDRHGAAGIVCWKPDRLARNALDGGQIIDAIDRKRLGSIVTPGRIYRDTSDDKLMLNFEFGISKKYVDDLSDNIRRGNRELLSSGRVPGIVPLGYLKEAPSDHTRARGAGRTIPDPERFPLVKDVFRRFATGRYTLSEIARIAREDMGLRTRGMRGCPSGPISMNSIYTMLRNPFYMGLIRHAGDIHVGSHEPMVTKSEFDQIQGLLRNHANHRPQTHVFTYRGVVRCACGRGTTAELHRKQSGLTFAYYRCTRRLPDPAVCRKPYASERNLEQNIADALEDLTVPERFVRAALGRLDQLDVADERAARSAQESLRRELATRERELARLMAMALRELVDDEQFVAEKTRLLAEKLDLERKLADTNPMATVTSKLQEIILVATEASNAFRAASPEERRTLVMGLCDAIVLDGDAVQIRFAKPFAILAGHDSPTVRPKGANPRSRERNPNARLAKRASEPPRGSLSSHARCPEGANQGPVSVSSLNKRESRPREAARSMTFSRWWTTILDVRTWLESEACGQDIALFPHIGRSDRGNLAA